MTARAIVASDANDLTDRDLKNIERIYDLFADAIKAAFDSEDSSAIQWIQLVGEMMGAAQSLKTTGAKKKQILMAVLREVIDNEVDAAHRDAARDILDTFVSPAIDVAVIYRQNIKTWWRNVRGWFRRKCGCC